MLYLVAALALGIAMQMPFAAASPLMRAIWPAYLHLLVLGWLTQLIFGVAYWMFPVIPPSSPGAASGLAGPRSPCSMAASSSARSSSHGTA